MGRGGLGRESLDRDTVRMKSSAAQRGTLEQRLLVKSLILGRKSGCITPTVFSHWLGTVQEQNGFGLKLRGILKELGL